VSSGTRLLDAVEQMADRKFSELPVVDAARCPIGLLDVTDLVGHPDDLAQSDQSDGVEAPLPPTVRIFDSDANAG
jgi:arabinose-5-phosphate isomerase